MQNTSSNLFLKIEQYRKRVEDIENLIAIMYLFPSNKELSDDVMEKLDILEKELEKEFL